MSIDIKDILKRAAHPKEWKALYRDYKEPVNYVIFGVLTTVVSFGTYYLFRFIFPDENSVPSLLKWVFNLTAVFGTESSTALPVILSWICAVTFAYITNRIWVFESKAKGLAVFAECGKFFGARVLTLLVDMLIMFLMVDLTGISGALWELFAKIVDSVVVLILNYLLSKLLVFRKKA
ncbi:MAG: GtrA family protein [Firmicutes bacterium]|nr:GtrA family protein [[Eubacterium] siraeum]MCM1488435.1 GtrA family protein [Bacillota bacterium]